MEEKDYPAIWNRIVEAFEEVLKRKGKKPSPTAIAQELRMAQTSVRDWQIGKTTPSRANILEIAERTKWMAGYLEDGAPPRRRPKNPEMWQELADIWEHLLPENHSRVVERAATLFERQVPPPREGGSEDTEELQ